MIEQIIFLIQNVYSKPIPLEVYPCNAHNTTISNSV